MADTGQCHLRVAKTLLNSYSIKFTMWNLPCTYPCLWVCVCARIQYVMMHELQKYWFMEHRVTSHAAVLACVTRRWPYLTSSCRSMHRLHHESRIGTCVVSDDDFYRPRCLTIQPILRSSAFRSV